MVKEKEHINLEQWTEVLLSKGRHSFSLHELRASFPALSDIALKYSLLRLSKKHKIISIVKGYYLVMSPQYYAMGILPPDLFIDGLMKYLNRPYYVGLLSAAAYYGAAHQQPQEYFVFTRFPVMRPTLKYGLKINYISVAHIYDSWLEQKKTETGYLKISNPLLTAFDIVQFDKRIGGLNRAATVLEELIEVLSPQTVDRDIVDNMQVSTVQRLGYIVDNTLHNEAIANELYKISNKNKFFRIPLQPASPSKACPFSHKWKIEINTEIETDL